MPEKQHDSESDGSSTCSCPKTAKKELLQVENECPTNEIENHEGDKLSEDKELCDLAKQFETALKRVKDREALSPPKSAEQPFFDAVCISLTPTTQTTCCSKRTRRKRKNNYDKSRPAFNDNNEENDDESHEISCACSSCHCGSKASFSSSCPDLPPYDDADDEDVPSTKIPAKNCDKKNKKKEDKCNLPCGCKTSTNVTGKISRNLGCRLASRLRNVDVTSGFQIQADARGKSVSVNRTKSLRTDTTYYQAQPVDEAVSCNLPVSSGSSDASRSTSSVAEYESERSSLNGGDDAIVADCRMQKDRFRRPPRGERCNCLTYA
ncbi:hypothetical protein QAD02_008744 [Eretmocerus hayati]|uniref:Uncharacterized protein n=1 Tax=Eretmocerus hayati TaxID=131215 RepID=A0ACC2N7E6_9HYME|nr:hypothetical protein QAD02_008744 [Eretmocerus hayati]